MQDKRPILEDLNNGTQKLHEPFVFVWIGYIICIPTGYVTDWASIPFLFRWLIPKMGPYNIAVLIHDFLYQYQYCDRKTADEFMRDIALLHDTPKWQARLMYSAVRIGGWKGWYNKKRIIYKYQGHMLKKEKKECSG